MSEGEWVAAFHDTATAAVHGWNAAEAMSGEIEFGVRLATMSR